MVNDFVKITDKARTLSRELNMHFMGVPCDTSMDREDDTQDSLLGSPSDSREVTTQGKPKLPPSRG